MLVRCRTWCFWKLCDWLLLVLFVVWESKSVGDTAVQLTVIELTCCVMRQAYYLLLPVTCVQLWWTLRLFFKDCFVYCFSVQRTDREDRSCWRVYNLRSCRQPIERDTDWYLDYLGGDFEVFAPQGWRCTDGVKSGMDESSNFARSVQSGEGPQEPVNVTKFRNINVLQGHPLYEFYEIFRVCGKFTVFCSQFTFGVFA